MSIFGGARSRMLHTVALVVVPAVLLLLPSEAAAGDGQATSAPSSGSKAATSMVTDACKASPRNSFTALLAPGEQTTGGMLGSRQAVGEAAARSTINVTFVGHWPAGGEGAVRYAAGLWEQWLVSPVPIEVVASWTSAPSGSLAVCTTREYVPDVSSLSLLPVSLANALAGEDLYPGEPDMDIAFDSGTDWSYTTEGYGYVSYYDMVTVAMHEIGHGLGLNSSIRANPYGSGLWWGWSTPTFGRLPMEPDRFMVDGGGYALIRDGMDCPSDELLTRSTNDDVWWNGTWGTDANGGSWPKIYAPPTWDSGSSMSHLDENTYPPGDIDSLMSPMIGMAEIVHYPGPVALGMLLDLGWNVDTTLAEPRPDIQARNSGDRWFTGNNVYNETSDDTDQTVAQTVDSGTTAVYEVMIQNDGRSYDRMTLSGGPGYQDWSVRYYYVTGGQWMDVTDAVTGVGLNLGQLPAGDGRSLVVHVSPSANSPGGKPLDVILIARSGIDSTYDRLRLQTTKPPISAVALGAAPASPQLVGTSVNLTATPTGGGPCTYTFSVRDTGDAVPGEWHTIQEGPAVTCVWRPTFAGLYQVLVAAQDGGGPPVTDRLDYEVRAPLTGVTLSADPASPRAAGTPVRLTALPVGAMRPEYRFTAAYLDSGVPVEKVLADWSPSSSVLWTPPVARRYELAVEARDVGDPARPTRQGHLLFDVVPPLSALDILVLPPSPQLEGTAVHVKAMPTGGQHIEYQLRIAGTRSDGTTVDETRAWTPDALHTVTLDAGDYTLTIAAREVGQVNEVTAEAPYTVVAPLTSVALGATPVSPQVVGTPISLTAAADGGFAPLFHFEVGRYTELGLVWTTLQRSSPDPTAGWTPDSADEWLIRVTASDTSGSSSATVAYDVRPRLSGVALAVPLHTPARVGTPITLAATAVGGAHVEYRFELYRRPGIKGEWTVVSDWAPASSCVWTPQALGNYQLRVLAREQGSTETFVGEASAVARP